MAYKIVITKINKDVPYTRRDWKQLRDEEEKDPSGKNELYGYVESESTHDIETAVFEQQVDDLDMKAVVAVINNIEAQPYPVAIRGEE